MKKNLLITGGCGFIASNLINYFFTERPNEFKIINLDKIDYCANINNILPQVQSHPNYTLVPGNCCSADLVTNLLTIHKIDIILHLAAQSHVDNSFGNSLQFTQDNIVATHNLLECSKKYGKLQRFVYMSTDEVQGDFNLKVDEKALNPTNPYAATKAACELLVESYAKSFKLPVVIVRSNNVFGPRQFWEKLIPRFITLLTQGKKLTIQGSGTQTRVFVYEWDVCRALELIMEKGELNEIYSIGTEDEFSVLQIAQMLIAEMKGGKFSPDWTKDDLREWVNYVQDRDFNDSRYLVDTTKLRGLGWVPSAAFTTNLKTTVDWYQNHPDIMLETSDRH
jgi:dTDP-glucose 4,6-dehydratase